MAHVGSCYAGERRAMIIKEHCRHVGLCEIQCKLINHVEMC